MKAGIFIDISAMCPMNFLAPYIQDINTTSNKAMTKTALAVLLSISWKSKYPESKHIGNPKRNATKQETTITATRLFLNCGNSSIMDATKASHPPHMEEMAKTVNMKKNMKLKKGPGFMTVTASGYT